MIKKVFTTLATVLVIAQTSYAAYNITGKVVLADRTPAVGAIVTISAPEDATVQTQNTTLGVEGSYKLSIGGTLFDYTRLVDIKVEKAGYQTILLSKVISSSFVVEDIVLVPNNATFYKPYLNLIARSETGKNIVAWERDKDKAIDYYTIKRKNANGIFDNIGKVEYEAMYSIYIDETADVSFSQYYLIEAVFTDGTISVPSNTRKSFELNFDKIPLETSLLLDFSRSFFDGLDYPANEISRVQMLRSYNGGTFDTIADKLLSDITYADVDSIVPDDILKRTGKYQYKVCVNYKDTVFPAILKSESGPFSQSMSNLAEAIILDSDIGTDPVDPTGTPLRRLNDFGIARIYPVPTYGSFTVESGGAAELIVSALTGETVLELPFTKTVTVSDRRLIPGIYSVSVICDGETKTFLQVIK